MLKFGNVLVGCVRSDVVEFCMIFLSLVLSRFDRLGYGMERVLRHSPSEAVTIKLSEGCFNGMFSGGVGPTVNIPCVFTLVVCLVCAWR